MKGIPTKQTFASRSLLVVVTLATLCVVPVATTVKGHEDDQRKDVFYTTSSPSVAGGSEELFAIEVNGRKVTTTDIGPINEGGCASLAGGPAGGRRKAERNLARRSDGCILWSSDTQRK
jgi:hypothetical protein